jgi:hypothetical protein
MIRAGVPAALITTSVFRGLAESERQAKGAPDLPLLVIDHPLGGERAEAVALRAGQAMKALAAAAGRSAAGARA